MITEEDSLGLLLHGELGDESEASNGVTLSIADLDWKCKAGLHLCDEFIRTRSVSFRFVCYDEFNQETRLFHPFSTSTKS